ncbi:MAG: 23S rRNA (pseudouridine(1915)-N(3))-methyltransferase RlmH [Omnitrophica WOR_2 bacterium]|jgi:23S rRNA (pseudouridine1915-N3)-methyltransferase
MKITLLAVGKTENNYLNEGINLYIERLSHYIKFEVVEIQIPKNVRKLNSEQLKDFEGKSIIKYFQGVDLIILLDEKGQNYNSEQFAEWIQKNMNAGIRHLMFVVGGPFGFSKDVYNAAHAKISLSAMTFSHQMVRLFFTEQLYRAFTILRNEPYHNA